MGGEGEWGYRMVSGGRKGKETENGHRVGSLSLLVLDTSVHPQDALNKVSSSKESEWCLAGDRAGWVRDKSAKIRNMLRHVSVAVANKTSGNNCDLRCESKRGWRTAKGQRRIDVGLWRLHLPFPILNNLESCSLLRRVWAVAFAEQFASAKDHRAQTSVQNNHIHLCCAS